MMHVAWMPIVTRYSLGDYGLCRGGVFEPVGNVRELGVEVEEVPGRLARLDFVSSGATMVRKVAGIAVDAFPGADAEAELQIHFEHRSSVLLRSPELTSTRIGNVAAVGRQLVRARRPDGLRWSTRYRMVSELFTGNDVTLISARANDATVVITGRAEALRRFEGIGSSVELRLRDQRSLGLDLVGARGSVGLDLVRFSRHEGRVLAHRGPSAGDVEVLEPEAGGWTDRWEDDPEDDL